MFNTGVPVLVFYTFNELRSTFLLSDLVFSGHSDAVETSTVGSLTRHLGTKFVIDFDFTLTLSSSAPSCVLFNIALTLLRELKWLMLNKHKRWIHSSRVNFSLCQYVCELILDVNVFDLDLGDQIDSIKQSIKSNSVGSGNMSHCRTSSLYDHLGHCFVVFKDVQQSLRREEFTFEGNKINIV